MSRRLGDDPLSRERRSTGKNRRSGPREHPSSGFPVATPNDSTGTKSQLRPESISQGPYSPSAPQSYNDVFFERRSDDKTDEVGQKSGPHATAPIVANPIPPFSSAGEPFPPISVMPAELATSFDLSTPDVDTSAPQTQSWEGVISVNPATLPTGIGEEHHAEAQKTQPKVQGGGLLKRILGRLRK